MNRTFIVWTYSRAGVIGVVASEATAVQVPLEVIASTSRIVPSDLQQLALETVDRRMKTYRPGESLRVEVERAWKSFYKTSTPFQKRIRRSAKHLRQYFYPKNEKVLGFYKQLRTTLASKA